MVDEGQSALQSAMVEATDTERSTIETLLTIGRWITLLAESLSDYGAALEILRRAETYFENKQFEDASTQSNRAVEKVKASRAHYQQATNLYGEIDVSTLEPLGEVSSDIRTGLHSLRERGDRLDTYANAVNKLAISLHSLSIGRNYYIQAKTAANDGDLDTAQNELKRASAAFSEAITAANDGEEIAPNAILGSFIELSCKSEHVQDATDSLLSAISARQAGDDAEADTHLSQAATAERQAANCE